jgi:hypothetical protein
MPTIANLITKAQLSAGKQSLRIVKATHDSQGSAYLPEKNQKENGRIAILFGSNEHEGLASESVMPDQLDWVLPIWISKLKNSVSFDLETDFESDFAMRESIVASLNDAVGEYFDMVVEEADLAPIKGTKLFNCTFA